MTRKPTRNPGPSTSASPLNPTQTSSNTFATKMKRTLSIWLVSRALSIALSSALLPAFAVAQWVNYPTAGIPLTRDNKPDLTAPAPKTAGGKPDLSGIWEAQDQ